MIRRVSDDCPPPLLFPALQEDHLQSLQHCVSSILDRFDVLVILASGTIVRGNPDPGSDLDIHVVHKGEFRQRIQEFHLGTPCELFVNPEHRIKEYFKSEMVDRRPYTTHMFATGFLVLDTDGLGEALVGEAREQLKSKPEVDSAALTRLRYGAATLFEDAAELAERDAEGATLLLGHAVVVLVECRMYSTPGWLPRPKDTFSCLRTIDPLAADLAHSASHGALEERLAAARELCKLVTEAEGFFEWASPQE